MEGKKEIRWKQRFQNFEKAFLRLSSAVEAFDKLDDLSREGLIQRFEYTFELSWKTMKDYLNSKNVDVKYPRDVLKSAFKYDLVSEGEVWLDMLKERNLLTHTYDEDEFNKALSKIINLFYPKIKEIIVFFKEKQNE